MSLLTGKISTDGRGNFVDDEGRVVNLRGINLDGGCKFPSNPKFPTFRTFDDDNGLFFDGDNVSFVGRPFPIDEVATHIVRIKSLGFNIIRYIVTWEAIEHEGPGIYDLDYVNYTVEVLKIIRQVGGIYVYIDPHQDVWSRYCGGDGAPMWTLYAAGLDPKHFDKTEAAILQNYFPKDKPSTYPDMLWPTNYRRLAAGTLFTLFFAGKAFAPNAIINGVNIQDFLQSHFIGSIQFLIKEIVRLEPSLFDELIIGVESMNEPNSGFLTIPNAGKVPDEQHLRRGTCPNIFEALKLGMGIATEVEEYKISIFGVKKIGTKWVNPKGTKAWLTTNEFDKKYGFKRHSSWKLGECIWAQNGVWDPRSHELLIPDYFAVHPVTGDEVNEKYFINKFFVKHYKDFKFAIRSVLPDTLMFLQPPTMQIPPNLKDSYIIDENTVFCAHYYDGMTLMFRNWNRYYNVDTIGVIRGRYMNPILGIVFGEKAIRHSFKQQLKEMKAEGEKTLGYNIPIIFSEIGMPYSLDNRRAYKTDNYDQQTDAIDAFGFALEASNFSFTWWCYTAENSHRWGDGFNNEDFSVWSKDDYDGYQYPAGGVPGNKANSVMLNEQHLQHHLQNSNGNSTVDSSNAPSIFDSENDSSAESSFALRHGGAGSAGNGAGGSANGVVGCPSYNGFRAIDSLKRPYAIAISGEFIESEFNLKELKYELHIRGDSRNFTKIYLPNWHFPSDGVDIQVSSGRFEFNENNPEVLEWHHGSGVQKIVCKNIHFQPKSDSIWDSLYQFGGSVFSCCS